jgi:hypothetical protein
LIGAPGEIVLRTSAHARGNRPPDVVGISQFHTAAGLDAAALSAVLRRIRSRVLRLAVRHGARPNFASERLSRDGSDQLVRYRLTKPPTTPRAPAPHTRDPPRDRNGRLDFLSLSTGHARRSTPAASASKRQRRNFWPSWRN